MPNSEAAVILGELAKQEKVVLLSIRPEFSRLIFSGRKTIELRKRLPKFLGRFILVYESSPSKVLAGVLKVRRTRVASTKQISRLLSKARVSKVFFDRYYAGKDVGAYYEIENAVYFERKIPLAALRKHNLCAPQDYRYLDRQLLNAILAG